MIEYVLAGWLSLPPLDINLGRVWDGIKSVVRSEEPGPNDYQEVLKNLSKKYENLTTDSFYKEVKFKDDRTGKTRRVSELNQLEKDVFYLMECNRLAAEMVYYHEIWVHNAKVLAKKNKNKKPGRLICPLRPRAATAVEVDKFSGDLLELRKKIASKTEVMMADLYQNHADVFTRQEAEYHIRAVRQQHDKEKLVERPKK